MTLKFSTKDSEVAFRAKLAGSERLARVSKNHLLSCVFGLLIFFIVFLVLATYYPPLSMHKWAFFIDCAVSGCVVVAIGMAIHLSHEKNIDFTSEEYHYRLIREGDKFHFHVKSQIKITSKDDDGATQTLFRSPVIICDVLDDLFVPGISCISIVSPWFIKEKRMAVFLETISMLMPSGFCFNRVPETHLGLIDSIYALLPFVGVPAWRKREDKWRLRATGIEIRQR